ncbi:MAG: methionine synthase [Clostridia bacterium]|nr:methionine synthase [Clostridia bacterium]
MTDYTIDKSRVLRYLGITGEFCPPDIDGLIEALSHKLCSLVSPKYTYKIFPLTKGEGFVLADCGITLLGNTANEYLQGCDSCGILSATLGHEADNLIRRTQVTNMTEALIYDACATDLTEKVCDRAQREIEELAKAEGKTIGTRFSPGYGDLDIGLQRDICSVLDTGRKIGMTHTDDFLLLPTKSVTAFVGIGLPQKINSHRAKGCENCNMKTTCAFCKKDIQI